MTIFFNVTAIGRKSMALIRDVYNLIEGKFSASQPCGKWRQAWVHSSTQVETTSDCVEVIVPMYDSWIVIKENKIRNITNIEYWHTSWEGHCKVDTDSVSRKNC